MPTYTFVCPNGSLFEARTSSDDIWATCPCHGVPGKRDLHADLVQQYVNCDDHIRRAFNGSKIDHALSAQGRPLDPMAPKDKFEAKHIEKATGRVYCGDDISGLRPISQRAILHGKGKT